MTPPPDSSGDKKQAPTDLGGIEQAITALTTFLRNGQVNPDQRPFNEDQLAVENDFRALVRGLGRPRSEDELGRFTWRSLAPGRLELTEPLPAGMRTIGGYTADRREVWLVGVAAASRDRVMFAHERITDVGVVRLVAFDAAEVERLVGFPAEDSPSPATPPVVR